MDVLGVVILLVLLSMIAAGVAWLVYDYTVHKKQNDSDITSTQKMIIAEKESRVSNVNHVVDQVNTVNRDIFATMTSNVDHLQRGLDSANSLTGRVVQSLNNVMQFTSNTAGAQPMSLLDMPGVASPNVHLMQHVIATMGLTANDLQPGVKSVKFCSPGATKCISIPDSNGDVYLTSLSSNAGSGVHIDAPLTLHGDTVFKKGGVDRGRLVTTDSGVVFQTTGSLGVGTSLSLPSASLHVVASGTQPAFKVTGTTADAVLVRADGELVTNRPIQILAASSDVNASQIAGVGATLSVDANQQLTITAPTVKVAGNLHYTGSLSNVQL